MQYYVKDLLPIPQARQYSPESRLPKDSPVFSQDAESIVEELTVNHVIPPVDGEPLPLEEAQIAPLVPNFPPEPEPPIQPRKRDLVGSLNSSLHLQPRSTTRTYFSIPQTLLSLKPLAQVSKVHAISLYLPPDDLVFGDPFAPTSATIPYLVKHSVGHLPLTVYSDIFPFQVQPVLKRDWTQIAIISTEDLVEAIISATELLYRASGADYLRKVSIMTEIPVVPESALNSPHSSYARDIVNLIRDLTRSESPISIGNFAVDTPLPHPVWTAQDRELSPDTLGLGLQAPIPMSLQAYVSSLFALQMDYLSTTITEQCKPPESMEVLRSLALDMDQCFTQLIVLVDGASWSLACSQELEEYEQPVALLHAVPHAEGVRGVRISVQGSVEGEIKFQMSCPTGPGGADEVVVWSTEESGSWQTITDAPNGISTFQLDFVRRESAAFSLAFFQMATEAPRRQIKHKLVVKEGFTFFAPTNLELPNGATVADLRFNEICCSNGRASNSDHFFLRNDRKYFDKFRKNGII